MGSSLLFHRFGTWVRDIRFWLGVFFLVRLVGITNPPLESGHNWRQSLTNMIARNFAEHDESILYPQIDYAGEKTGIIGAEFPVFNFLIYLVSVLFGYDHWYGRLINLIVSTLGIWFFFRLVRDWVSEKAAFYATMVLSVSIWFAFSRKIMPDTFSVALVLIGLYYAFRFLKSGEWWSVGLFFVFSSLGLLCKIPALSLFSVLGMAIFLPQIPWRRVLVLYGVGAVSVAIMGIWYFYWVPYLLDTYQYQLFFPRSLSDGLREISGLLPQFFERFYFSSLHSFVALAFCLIGIYFLIKRKERGLLVALGLISLVFGFFIIKTGEVFPLHNYYIVPFTPVMAFLAGYAISQVPSKFRAVFIGVIVIEAVANQFNDFFIKDSQQYKLTLDGITQQYIPKTSRIAINGGLSPQTMYFAHCHGWSVYNEDLPNSQFLDSLHTLGAEYLVIDKHTYSGDFEYPKLYDGVDFAVYGF